MRVLGVDPSSTICGMAVIEGGIWLHDTDIWRKDATKSGAWNLNNYFEWLAEHIRSLSASGHESDMACVEFLSVQQNAQTTRKVSHFQAASVLACKQEGLMVVEARPSSARKEALGAGWGNRSKEDVFDEVRRRFPDHTFRPKHKDKGGMDETDAVVLALAGPGLAER